MTIGMKIYTRLFLIVLFSLSSMMLMAQLPSQIAYVNSDELLATLPEKARAQKEVTALNKKYKDELVVMQNDYNKKYSDFISFQTSMAENIRLRRMQELFELEKQINNFIEVAQNDVVLREQELLIPLKAKIKKAIDEVGIEGQFVCIYDLANPAILFVTPSAVDITELVKLKLAK